MIGKITMHNRLLALLVFVLSGVCAGCGTRGLPQAAPGPAFVNDSSFSLTSPEILQGNQGSKFLEVLSVDNSCHKIPGNLSAGPEHTVWYLDYCSNSAFKIDMTGKAVEYKLNGSPMWITAGPDHNMWVTMLYSDKIAKVTPGGSVTYYSENCTNSNTTQDEITAGPDGNLWFTIFGNSLPATGVGRMSPSGVSTCYATSEPVTRGITAGPDGNVWFTEPNAPTMLGKITPAGVLTEYPDANFCIAIIRAGDGNLYCGSLNGMVRIDPITAAETVVTPRGGQRSIAASGTGVGAVIYYSDDHYKLETLHLWNNHVARDTIPSNEGRPLYVAFGPDENLWYDTLGPQVTNFVGVEILKIITASPSTVTLGIGQSQTITASETHYVRQSFAGTSSNNAVASIAPAGGPGAFTVTGVAAGSAVLTIDDKMFNSVTIPVTVH